MDTELEISQYLFDLNGYLVIDNVLDPKELSELNGRIDEQELRPPDPKFPRFGSAAGAIRSTGPG